MKNIFAVAILAVSFAAFAEGTGGTPATTGGAAAPTTVQESANKMDATAKPETKGEGAPKVATKKSYKDLKKECTDKDATLKGKALQNCIKDLKKNAA